MAEPTQAQTFAHLLKKLEDLPTLPAIAQKLTQLIADPMSSTAQIEALIENDVSLTTKVLRLVNSAYYGIPGGVKTLGRAIGFLGFDTVHQLVLSAAIFSSLEGIESDTFQLPEFWKHSVGTGMAAECIARMVKYKAPADLFTCGLVHDLGKIAYIVVDNETFSKIVAHAATQRVSFFEAEAALKVPSHTELGFELSKIWNLPANIQQSIRYHHEKNAALRVKLTPEMQTCVDITFLANLFIHGLNFGNSGHTQIQSAPKILFDRLGLNTKLLPQLSKEISKSLASSEAFLKVLMSKPAKDTKAA